MVDWTSSGVIMRHLNTVNSEKTNTYYIFTHKLHVQSDTASLKFVFRGPIYMTYDLNGLTRTRRWGGRARTCIARFITNLTNLSCSTVAKPINYQS